MNTDQHRFGFVKRYSSPVLSVFICVHLWFQPAAAQEPPKWEKRWLTAFFYSEGANVGDIDNDGVPDVVSGPFWYKGPDFMLKHEFMPVQPVDPLTYSHNFFTFVHDINDDGWADIVIIGFPGAEAAWYENPKGASGHWKKHLILDVVDNESPTLVDLTGDGTPELVCMSRNHLGYAKLDTTDPTKPWRFIAISPKNEHYQRFTHGLGVGDVNGNGRLDILEKNGWWEQPESLDAETLWTFHPVSFGEGGAQMYAYDVDGDGRNDVITSIQAHGWGVAWFRQLEDGTFEKHLITGSPKEPGSTGVRFSQPHALALADVNGDGLLDIITGKRYWAHGPTGDPQPNAPAVLYWFQLVRENGEAKFVPHRIDDNSGVGVQVVAADATGNGRADVVVGNKKGSFIFIQRDP